MATPELAAACQSDAGVSEQGIWDGYLCHLEGALAAMADRPRADLDQPLPKQRKRVVRTRGRAISARNDHRKGIPIAKSAR